MGGADAERFSIGAEGVTYEGPLQLRLQVRLKANLSSSEEQPKTAASRQCQHIPVSEMVTPW